jgi:hypothetical protein
LAQAKAAYGDERPPPLAGAARGTPCRARPLMVTASENKSFNFESNTHFDRNELSDKCAYESD